MTYVSILEINISFWGGWQGLGVSKKSLLIIVYIPIFNVFCNFYIFVRFVVLYVCLCVFACAQMCGCTVVCELWKFKCLFKCDVTGVTSFIQGITCF